MRHEGSQGFQAFVCDTCIAVKRLRGREFSRRTHPSSAVASICCWCRAMYCDVRVLCASCAMLRRMPLSWQRSQTSVAFRLSDVRTILHGQVLHVRQKGAAQDCLPMSAGTKAGPFVPPSGMEAQDSSFIEQTHSPDILHCRKGLQELPGRDLEQVMLPGLAEHHWELANQF